MFHGQILWLIPPVDVSPYRAFNVRRDKGVPTGLDPGLIGYRGFRSRKLLNPGYHKVVPLGLKM